MTEFDREQAIHALTTPLHTGVFKEVTELDLSSLTEKELSDLINRLSQNGGFPYHDDPSIPDSSTISVRKITFISRKSRA